MSDWVLEYVLDDLHFMTPFCSPSATAEIQRACLLTWQAFSVECSAFRHSCHWGRKNFQISHQSSLFQSGI